MKKLLPFLFLFPYIALALTTVPWARINSSGVYPNFSTDQVMINETSTSTTAKLEVNGLSNFIGGFLSTASSTIVGNATTTGGFAADYYRATGTATSTFTGLQGTYLNLTGTTASSTIGNGFNLTKGCYAISGTCVGGSAFVNTLANGGTATTTFYSGGVVFSDASKLTQSAQNSNFFWDETNKRLGIGTASPVTPLDVRQPGTGSTAIIYNTGTGANDNTLEFRSGWANLANTSQRLATIVTAPDAFSGSRFILNVTNTSGTLFEAFRVNSSGTFTMSASGSGWIDMPTGVASGIGTGGAGVNPWLANVASINQWFTNSVAGDLAYRNTGGRMFFGNTTSYPAMIIGSDRLGIGPSIGVPTALLQIQPTNATSTPSLIIASTTGATFVQINRDGFLGVATSTPSTQLDVYTASSTAGTAQTNPFSRLVEMVIGGVYYMVESFDYYGHLITAGPTTTLTSCGTSTVSGNDRNGTIYLNGVAITTCTMNFAKPYVSAPDCVVTDNSVASFAVASSTLSQLVIGISGAGLNSGAVTYQCIGHR